MSKRRCRWVALAMVFGLAGFGLSAPNVVAEAVPIARWFAERPAADAVGKTVYLAAPEWLAWQKRDADDATMPAEWLHVRIALPSEAPKVWCQHAGAIAELAAEIPAGQRFRVRFKARAITGARVLKVLRRWGGLKRPYWEGIVLTDTWQEYSIELAAEEHPTLWIVFSTVASERPLLQPVASGEFLLADIAIETMD